VHPDHQEHAWAVWRHSLTTGEPYQIEYCLKRYDGVYRWFLGRALPLRDESGVILKWFGTCTDIDDQKKAAELLEQSEARTRLAVEAANLGTFEINVAAQTIIHSPRTAEIIGLDPAVQWPYQSFLNSLYPEDKAVREKAHENARRTGNLYYEARVILPDKTIRWIRINGVLIDKDSTSILIGTKKDITEEKRAAELLEQKIEERTRELEAQKSLLNNILTNSSNGISVTEMIRDESGNVVDARTILANDAAVNYIGLPREMFLSKTAVELDPNILSSDYGQICLNTLRTGEPALSQYYMEATGRWQELTISKMDDDHLIHIFTDVTPIKEAQLQLERTVEELRRSNRNLEEFAYAASHDLKEPIRKIYFFTNQLKDQLSNRLTEGEERSLSRIENASQRMGNLVDDLLIYSHVSQQPHEKESVDLNEKIQRVLEDLELDIKEKKANIHVGNLPTVGGYRRQLQQLFQNLISNALKYSKRNIPPLIDITACQVRENNKLYHRIEVKDNGIGFEQQYADKIFQMFTRLHGKAEYSGTGVGLSIVKKVVENHNGNIRVESTLGQGSTFTVLLLVD
jgi:PAS domain S-box-containing protein